jgi:hypothetical protein
MDSGTLLNDLSALLERADPVLFRCPLQAQNRAPLARRRPSLVIVPGETQSPNNSRSRLV